MGAVGSEALRHISAHPDLDLVGVSVYSDSKNGVDVGELVGLGPVGIMATNDRDAFWPWTPTASSMRRTMFFPLQQARPYLRTSTTGVR